MLALPSAETAGAPACTISWDGGAGTTGWADAANWSPERTPGAADHVCILAADAPTGVSLGAGSTAEVMTLTTAAPLAIAGTLTLRDAANESTVANAALDDGTLDGAGTLRITGTMTWRRGAMRGNGATVVAPGGRVGYSDAGATVRLVDRTLRNEGTLEYEGGNLDVQGTGAIENAGVFELHGAGTAVGGPDAALRNSGRIVRSSGAGPLSLFIPVSNSGRIEAATGELVLNGGGSAASGAVFAGDGAGVVRWTSNKAYRLAEGVRLEGNVAIGEGQFGSPAHVAFDGRVTASGTVALGGHADGPGTLAVTGRLDMNLVQTGAVAGTIEVAPTGTAHVQCAAFSGGCFLGNWSLVNDGTLAIGPGKSLHLGADAVLDNRGTLALDGSSSVQSPLGSMRSTGTIRKTGADTGLVDASLDNDGEARAEAGVLQLRPQTTGASIGHYNAAAGATVLLDGRHTLGTGARLGDGVVSSGSGLNLVGDARVTGAAQLTTFVGPGDLTVEGSASWAMGNADGDGLLRVAAGGRLDMSGVGLNRALRNDGHVVWSAGGIFLGRGGVIDNYGTFDADPPQNFLSMVAFDGAPDLRNRGTLRKTVDSHTFIGVPVVNDGLIDLHRGALHTQGGYVQTANGRQRVELRGPNLLRDFGVIQASQFARLGGTVEVVHADGFTPQLGERYLILSGGPGGAAAGRFARLEGDSAGPGLRYELDYSHGQAALLVVSAPAATDAEAEFAEPVARSGDSGAQEPIRNRAPVAKGERLTLKRSGLSTLSLLANDRDPDGDRVHVELVRQRALPRGASARVVSGKLRIRLRGKARRARVLRVRYVAVDSRGGRSRPVTVVVRLASGAVR